MYRVQVHTFTSQVKSQCMQSTCWIKSIFNTIGYNVVVHLIRLLDDAMDQNIEALLVRRVTKISRFFGCLFFRKLILRLGTN